MVVVALQDFGTSKPCKTHLSSSYFGHEDEYGSKCHQKTHRRMWPWMRTVPKKRLDSILPYIHIYHIHIYILCFLLRWFFNDRPGTLRLEFASPRDWFRLQDIEPCCHGQTHDLRRHFESNRRDEIAKKKSSSQHDHALTNSAACTGWSTAKPSHSERLGSPARRKILPAISRQSALPKLYPLQCLIEDDLITASCSSNVHQFVPR